MSSQRNGIVVAVSVCLATILTGCGFSSSSSGCVAGPLVSKSSGANFSIVPTDYDVTIYPGGTAQFPVLIQPVGNATGQVTITGANLPQGLTMDSATGTIGSTVNLTLHASLNVASNCFTADAFIYSAGHSIGLNAADAAGSFSSQFPITIDLENPAFVPPTPSGLAVMRIVTDAATPVDSEDDYVNGTITVTDAANPANNYTGATEIKGHGNSTWKMPKKPYRLNLDKKTPLLGMTSDSNWILLANYDDKSMLRDDLAFHISNLVGMAWTPSTVFAELYLNGEYEGVYQVSEKVEVSKARLNIGSMDDTDISGDNLTGGYLAEIDHYYSATFMTHGIFGLPIGIDDPDPPTVEQSTYFVNNFVAAEESMYTPAFTDPTSGWRAHWDEDSVVQWFLVNELMGNVDGNDFSSDFFYKPREDARFYRGPVWDVDISAGNVNYSPVVSPDVPWIATQSQWYVQLFKDPAFVAAVKAKWTATRPKMGELPTYISIRAAALTPAAANNYGRWTTLGEIVVPNSEAAGSYAGEVDFLKNWITQRLAYMDAHYLN